MCFVNEIAIQKGTLAAFWSLQSLPLFISTEFFENVNVCADHMCKTYIFAQNDFIFYANISRLFLGDTAKGIHNEPVSAIE